MTIAVLIADDNDYVRDIFRFLLERAGNIEIVAVASNGREAVEQAAASSPDVVVMDISMPILDGIEATRQIRAHDPKARVVILSLHDDSNYVRSAVQAGALGYVLKENIGNDLVDAVHALSDDQLYFSKRIAAFAQPFLSEGGKADLSSGLESQL